MSVPVSIATSVGCFTEVGPYMYILLFPHGGASSMPVPCLHSDQFCFADVGSEDRDKNSQSLLRYFKTNMIHSNACLKCIYMRMFNIFCCV